MGIIQEYEDLMASLSAAQQEVESGQNEILQVLEQAGHHLHMPEQLQGIADGITTEKAEKAVSSCPNCHKPVKPEAKFCPYCGSAIVKALNNDANMGVSPSEIPPISIAQATSRGLVISEDADETEPEMTHTEQDGGESTRHCPYCGNLLLESARFCEECGRYSDLTEESKEVAPEKTTQEELKMEEKVSGERILGVLPSATQHSGFLGMKAEGFILVLTPKRILFAQQTKAMLKENAQQAKNSAKQEGKGFFGQMGAMIGSYSGQRYLQMGPDEIINETSGNYFIPNQQVRSIRLKEINDYESGTNTVKMSLKTDTSKLEFNFNNARKRQIKKLLQQTLGNIVR